LSTPVTAISTSTDHIGHSATHSHISTFDNLNTFKPFNESYVRSTASAPDESLWIDARRVIHVTTSFDESREPLVEHIRILETPPSLPPESEPPPYIDPDNSFRQLTTFLPVPDGHQHLLNYFATDLPALSDEHPVLLDEIAREYFLYCKCQDNLCAMDWNPDLVAPQQFVDEIREPFPTPGPRSKRDWDDRVLDLLDHRAHSRALIARVEASLSTRMLNEGLRRPCVLACDTNQRIGTHVPPSFYHTDRPQINPFFTTDEFDYLNSIVAVSEFHGEHRLAASIEAALLMPFPDSDIVHSLVEEHLLDQEDEFKVLKFARARDRALEIKRVRLLVVAYHSFRASAVTDAPQLHICTCFDSEDSDESDDEEMGPIPSHIFFLA
jgi:hypothetical protein